MTDKLWKAELRAGILWRVVRGVEVWGCNHPTTEAEAAAVATALNAVDAPPDPRWPTRPHPADLLLPLWKAEQWLAEQDGEDRAYTLAMAAANMPRATTDELRQTLATSQHADLRELAGAELRKREHHSGPRSL